MQRVKKHIKTNFTLFLLYFFFNVATRKLKILCVAHIIFLLNSAGTDQLLPATKERETETGHQLCPGAAGKSSHIYKSLILFSGNLGQCKKYQS